MTPKLWLGLGIAAILASGIGYGAYLRHQVSEYRDENKALSEALAASERELSQMLTARRADDAASGTKQRLLTELEAKEARRRAELDKAISDNPDWASTPVPPGVIDSLR